MSSSPRLADSARRPSARAAFTLIELIVVISVIAILAALLLPVLAGAKQKAIRMQCMSDVKQLDLAVHEYAMENDDHLPNDQATTIFTLPPELLTWLKNDNYTVKALYDPGLRPIGGTNASILWDETALGLSAGVPIGYGVVTSGAFGDETDPRILNTMITPQETQMGPMAIPAPDPTTQALVPGLVISSARQNNPANRYTYGYTGQSIWTVNPHAPTALPNIWLIETAHLDTAKKFPVGDNVGMLDGGAVWRRFEEMIPRATTNSFPCWW